MKIWYITRSYFPDNSGGAQLRAAQVSNLRNNGFDVEVISPKYERFSADDSNNKNISITNLQLRIGSFLQRFGVYDDYLDIWVKEILISIMPKIKKNDIIFATSGGELACVKIGSIIKSHFKESKFIVNFHDPVDYSLVNGLVIDDKLFKNRDNAEYKYISNADVIFTSSISNKNSLKNKYPLIREKILYSYFGYLSEAPLSNHRYENKLNIIYGGTFTETQKVEILAECLSSSSSCNVKFIGNHRAYRPLDIYRNKFEFIDTIPYRDYLQIGSNWADVGFVSLSKDYFGACIPSKIYEYINLGLPIIGCLPEGDALNIINDNKFGMAVKFNDLEGLSMVVNQLNKNPDILNEFKRNILKERHKWKFDYRFLEIVNWIRDAY